MKVEKGMKVKGFKFELGKCRGLEYHPDMKQYEGKEGVVADIGNKSFQIEFEDDYWYYPISLAHRAFLSVGDKVKIPKTKSVGFSSREHSTVVKVATSRGQDYLYYTGEYDGKLILNYEFCKDSGEYFTLEDIELYEQEKQNKMEIKKSELEKIYNVACCTWKNKIEALANRNAFGDSVELTQGEIDEMFRAANNEQTKVLKEVFGEQNQEIDLISESLEHTVNGIPVFGGNDKFQNDALITLPTNRNPQNAFWLNLNYDWKIEGKMLIVTRK